MVATVTLEEATGAPAPDANSNGPPINLTAGDGGMNGGNGGAFNITSGGAVDGGNSGTLTVKSGPASGGGDSGDAIFAAGTAVDGGSGGDTIIKGGDSEASGYGGDLILSGGDVTDSDGGLPGDIRLLRILEFADDTAATVGGVALYGLYRTGSALKMRVA